MIKLDVLSMLEKHNKSKYWLWKQLGMSYQNFNRMVNNETKSIKYETLDAQCAVYSAARQMIYFCTMRTDKNNK